MVTSNNPLLNLLYRPPFVGLLAFIIVFVVQALGHTVMIVMEEVSAIIAWNMVEIGGRWHLFTEFWEKPQEFALEMSLFTLGTIIAAILAVRTPAHKKAELSRQKLAAEAALRGKVATADGKG